MSLQLLEPNSGTRLCSPTNHDKINTFNFNVENQVFQVINQASFQEKIKKKILSLKSKLPNILEMKKFAQLEKKQFDIIEDVSTDYYYYEQFKKQKLKRTDQERISFSQVFPYGISRNLIRQNRSIGCAGFVSIAIGRLKRKFLSWLTRSKPLEPNHWICTTVYMTTFIFSIIIIYFTTIKLSYGSDF